MRIEGRNTKIAPSRICNPRFGLERDEPANGPLIEYTLTPEEIAEKYGPPTKRQEHPEQEKQITITRDELIAALRRNQSWSITMVSMGIGRAQMMRLMELYQVNPGDWKNKIEKEESDVSTESEPVEQPVQKTKLEIARERMPKEELTRLKEQDYSDKDIREKLGVDNDSFYKLKKEYGLYGVCKWAHTNKTEKQDAVAPVPEPEPEPEPEPVKAADPAPIDWICPCANTDEDYTAYVSKNGVTFSRLVSDTFLQTGNFMRIGVQGDKLVFAACSEKDDTNYTMRKSSARSHRMRLSGNALWAKLRKRGIQEARYHLEYSTWTGLWIGTRVEKEAAN